VRRCQRHRLTRKELAVGDHEGLAQVGQVLAQLGDMEAVLDGVTAVAIGDMTPHRDSLHRHRQLEEQLLEVGSVIATIAEGN